MKDIVDQIWELLRADSEQPRSTVLPECNVEVVRHPRDPVVILYVTRANGQKRSYRVEVQGIATVEA